MIQLSVVFQGPELCFPHRQVHQKTAHSLTAPISTCMDGRSPLLRASVSIALSQTRGILRSFGFPCTLWVLGEIFPRYTCLLGFPHSAVHHLLPLNSPSQSPHICTLILAAPILATDWSCKNLLFRAGWLNGQFPVLEIDVQWPERSSPRSVRKDSELIRAGAVSGAWCEPCLYWTVDG